MNYSEFMRKRDEVYAFIKKRQQDPGTIEERITDIENFLINRHEYYEYLYLQHIKK